MGEYSAQGVAIPALVLLTMVACGRLYLVSRHSSRILQLDADRLGFTTLVGTGTLGTCTDGTPALSCNIDPHEVFVNRHCQVYFMDRGRLRAIDETGNVVTIMGQPHFFGDGLRPLMARLASVANFDVWQGMHFILTRQDEA